MATAPVPSDVPAMHAPPAGAATRIRIAAGARSGTSPAQSPPPSSGSNVADGAPAVVPPPPAPGSPGPPSTGPPAGWEDGVPEPEPPPQAVAAPKRSARKADRMAGTISASRSGRACQVASFAATSSVPDPRRALARAATPPAMATVLPSRSLGRSGEQVSLLGVGGFHLGLAESEAEAIRIVRTAIDEGATFLDNCWDYHDGESERRMGKALADGWRDRAFLMTKIDGRDRATAARQIDESLRRLGTDRVDLMQIHEVIRASDPGRCFAPD